MKACLATRSVGLSAKNRGLSAHKLRTSRWPPLSMTPRAGPFWAWTMWDRAGHMPLNWVLGEGGYENEPHSQLQQVEHLGTPVTLEPTNASHTVFQPQKRLSGLYESRTELSGTLDFIQTTHSHPLLPWQRFGQVEELGGVAGGEVGRGTRSP